MSIRRVGLEVAGAGLLISGGAMFPAYASSGAAADDLEEIIVTATKREERLHEVAMSITALGGEDLERRQEASFVDWAAQVPGLSLQQSDYITNRVILRGQNVGSAGATIATTVDDIPFFMSGAQADGYFFSANLDTYDLQRVEVLRGPQGTLYGAAAEGGLIKYVTNPPDLTAIHSAVSLGGETLQGGSTVGMVKGMINLPFWNEKAALRVSATDRGLPGWIDNPGTHQTNANHGDQYSVRASLLVQPTSDFTARLTMFNQGLKDYGKNSQQVVGAALTPQTPPADQFARLQGGILQSGIQQIQHNRFEYYALNLNYDLHWATLTSASSYGRINLSFAGDLSNTNLAPGVTYGDVLSGAFGQPVLVTLDQSEFVHKLNQELRLASDPGLTVFGHALEWQVGGYFTRESTDLYQPYHARSVADPATLVEPPPLGGGNIPGQYKEFSYFGDVTYHFSKAFDVEIGGRGTHVKQSSHVEIMCCILAGPATTYPALNSSEGTHTWSVAPRWHISDETLLYARFATGFRPGGPNFPSPSLPTPPSFRSDSTRNYEVGLRTDIFDRRVSIDIAVYDIDWTDVQITSFLQTPNGPVGINGNAGSARTKGVEWNLAWRPVDGLTIGLLGAYTDAKLTADAQGLGAMSGDALPYVPKVSGTLNVDYSRHAFGNWSAFAGASETYTGTRYTAFSPSVTVIEPHVKLPTYSTLQVHLGLDNERYSAELYANNLTNELGINDYNNSGGYGQTGTAVFIQPRTIGIELGAKF